MQFQGRQWIGRQWFAWCRLAACYRHSPERDAYRLRHRDGVILLLQAPLLACILGPAVLFEIAARAAHRALR